MVHFHSTVSQHPLNTLIALGLRETIDKPKKEKIQSNTKGVKTNQPQPKQQ
jgi:hypothetical protein